MARVGSGVRRVRIETFQHGQDRQWGAEGLRGDIPTWTGWAVVCGGSTWRHSNMVPGQAVGTEGLCGDIPTWTGRAVGCRGSMGRHSNMVPGWAVGAEGPCGDIPTWTGWAVGCGGSTWRHSNMDRAGSGVQRVRMRHPNRAPGRAVGAEGAVRKEKSEQ